jgi:hypothetical protein
MDLMPPVLTTKIEPPARTRDRELEQAIAAGEEIRKLFAR